MSVVIAQQARVRTWQLVSRDILIVYYAIFGALHILLPNVFAPLLHSGIPLPRAASGLTGVFELVAVAGMGCGVWRRMAGLALAVYAAVAVPVWVDPAGLSSHVWQAWIAYVYEWLQVDLRLILIWMAMFASTFIAFPFRSAR